MMSDLSQRMKLLDAIEVPEVWSRVGSRMPIREPESRHRGAAVVAMTIAAVVAAAVYVAYRNPEDGPISPGPKFNGPIYFLGTTSHAGPASLYAVDPDGTDFRTIPLGGYPSSIAVSPDGSLIALSNGDGGEFSPRNIFVMQVDGSESRQITPTLAARRGPTLQESDEDWSPNGQHIVFASNRACCGITTSGGYVLFVVRSDGSSLRKLTEGPNDAHPAWSPDGSRIAFERGLSSASSDIWVVNSDGTNPRLIVSNERVNGAPAWSPDGTAIAYASFLSGQPGTERVVQRDWQVRIVRLDGSEDHPIYHCQEPCRFGGHWLEWSPNGKEVAFQFTRIQGTELRLHIGLVASDGGGFRILDTHGIQPYDLSWAAAG